MRFTLYGAGPSRSTRISWAFHELAVDYEYVHLEMMRGDHRRPEYLAINPCGKVPALRDDEAGLSLFESGAIITYLGDQHPGAGLVPVAGTADRGRYGQWLSFVASELEQPLWLKAKHTFALPEALRHPEVIPTAHKEFARAAKVLDGALGDGPWLLGEIFSGADIMAAHTLAWANKSEFDLGSDRLMAYMKRALSRPAFLAAVAREKAEKQAATEAGS